MQIGIVLAAVTISLLTTLNPDTPYWHEGIIMFVLGLGLGLVMPVLNIAVQGEFSQKELGVATSSVQLFRGLGSTIGLAVFGAMLTTGITANLPDMRNDDYIATLKSVPAAQEIGDLNDTNTLVNLNTPDVSKTISDNYERGIRESQLPVQTQDDVLATFKENQASFSDTIKQSFTASLRSIFIVSAVTMTLAAVLVFTLRERELAVALPDVTPGEQ